MTDGEANTMPSIMYILFINVKADLVGRNLWHKAAELQHWTRR